MFESIDWEDKHFLLKYIYPLSPSLHILIVLPRLLSHLLDHCSHIVLHHEFLLEYLPDELLKEEGRENMAFFVDLLGKEDELQEFEVVAYYCIVEIHLWLEFLHILSAYGEGLSTVQGRVLKSELSLGQLLISIFGVVYTLCILFTVD